jgi:GNAT superfamily N-acetyltransferase
MNKDAIQRDSMVFKPVTIKEWDDLQLLFGEPGEQNGCWCMYWRVKRSKFQQDLGELNRRAFQEIIESGSVPGILAYLDGKPIGWCSVAPREEFPVLDRSSTLKRVDKKPVWSIVCFFVSNNFRQKGVSKALIQEAVAYAGRNGAKIVEAYPLAPEGFQVTRYKNYMGVLSMFEEAGFQEVVRRSKKRPIMRFTLPE